MRMGHPACIHKPYGAGQDCDHAFGVIAVHLTDHPVLVTLPSVLNIRLILLVFETMTGGGMSPQRFAIKVLAFSFGLISEIVRES